MPASGTAGRRAGLRQSDCLSNVRDLEIVELQIAQLQIERRQVAPNERGGVRHGGVPPLWDQGACPIRRFGANESRPRGSGPRGSGAPERRRWRPPGDGGRGRQLGIDGAGKRKEGTAQEIYADRPEQRSRSDPARRPAFEKTPVGSSRDPRNRRRHEIDKNPTIHAALKPRRRMRRTRPFPVEASPLHGPAPTRAGAPGER